LLDTYVKTADVADQLLEPSRGQLTAAPGVRGVAVPEPADAAQAMEWFRVEHSVLVAASRHAAEVGLDEHAWQLPWSLSTFLFRRGDLQEWADLLSLALAAARRVDHETAQANVCRNLGIAHALMNHTEEALECYEEALRLFGRLGDRSGQGHTRMSLTHLTHRMGDLLAALNHAEQGLLLYRDDSYHMGQANALNAIGWIRVQMGDPRQALADCEQALALHRHVGDPASGAAYTLDSLGYAHRVLGEYAKSYARYREAIEVWREIGDRRNEADALTHLGEVYQEAADSTAASAAWREALDILEDLGDADADQVRALLATMDTPSRGAGSSRV
jgi:tetratricopeptide (TPR) repeat protein